MAFSKNRRLAQIISDVNGNLSVQGITVPTQSNSDNDTSAASTAFVHNHIDALVDSAPGTMNTLNEIAAALNDDANFNTTVTNAIAAKLPLAGGTLTGNLAHASNLTLDVGGGITLDCDGGQVDFKDGGTLKALIDFTGSNVEIQSRVTDADLLFRGQDGSSFITALSLDMSEAGAATFNAGATFGGALTGTSATFTPSSGENFVITRDGAGPFIGNSSNHDLRIITNNTERMRFDTSGRVGIGTNSPADYVYGDLVIDGITNSGNASGLTLVGTSYGGVFFADGTSGSETYRGFVQYNHNHSSLTDTLLLGAGGDTRMVIDSTGKVGIGTETPQKTLEVETAASSVVSVGVSQMSANNYAGINFGYKENNNNYRKSAIVFKRTDLTSNNAQGKVHILNGPLTGNGSATLSDRKLTIMENGNTEVPFIRAGAWSGDAMHTEGTDAIELGVSGGLGYVHGYDRTNSHYIELAYDGVAHRFSTSGGYPNVHIDANGNMAINTGAGAGTSATTQNSLMDAIAHTGTVLSNNGPVVMGRADGSNSGETGYQYNPSNEPRCIRNFFTYAGPSSNAYSSPYIHMKTNLWAGGSPHGNIEFTMSCFTFYDYYGYGANYSCYGTSGWHNWSGSYYNLMLRNYGNWDIAYNPYTSSDGYVVIVARVPNAYSQFSVDWAQWGGYARRERKITNVAQHNAATGKY